MTSPQRARKWDLPPYRVASRGADVDCVVFTGRHHVHLIATAYVESRREIVAVATIPRASNSHAAAIDLLKAVEAGLEEGTRPVAAATLRSIPLADVMQARRECITGERRIAAGMGSAGHVRRAARNLTPEEEAALPYLDDALTYARAVADGVSPAWAVVELRGCSKRTAEGRIARARKLGLLEPARGTSAAGGLTDFARAIQAKIEGRTKGQSNG